VRDINDPTTWTVNQTGKNFYRTDWKAFAPRLGASYQIRGGAGKEQVARGGFGIYYSAGSSQSIAPYTSSFPNIQYKSNSYQTTRYH
jgi:hypothetical protein